MARTARQPLVFEEEELRPALPPAPSSQEPYQQVGARIPRATYRRLKAHAALEGVTVATLVEQAITDFLAKNRSDP